MSRILIVDDAPSVLLMLSKLLTEHGYEVTSAKGGEEALRILQTEPFDLMISDINMEPINGLELLSKAKESCAKMKVILLTAYERHYSCGEAERSGAFAYIPKPFRSPVLLQAVRRALESSGTAA